MKYRSILKLGALVFFSTSSLFAQETSSIQKAPEVNEVIIKIPEVPEVPKVEAVVPKVESLVPKVILLDSSGNEISNKKIEYIPRKRKKVEFSHNVAPEKYTVKQIKADDNVLVGDIKNGRVAAYLHAPLTSADEAKENLKKAGFNILATYKIDKKGSVTSIVFSNKAMENAAAKKMRGFAGTLRLVVDNKNKLVNISNPIYAMGAFMQKEYDKKLAEETLKQLRDVFKGLKNSKELVKFKVLERFRFMENMPYYQDMQIVAKAKNKALLEKAKKSKQVVYEQHLSDGTVVLGVKLGKRTSKFVKKTGYENSGLLPYPVLIENGEAKIMAPQYYIAVMYPMLKMSQFMKIATVPGAITKDIDKIFR